MEQPLITIGIACYRSADTVGRAIQGALAQTWENKEILIVEDGSGDNTYEAIIEATKGHENVRIIAHETNKGFANALNTIIENAKGDFLAIFDDDDYSAPQRIFTQYRRITEYEKAENTNKVLCHSARIQKYPDGRERYEPTVGIGSGITPFGERMVDRILIGKLSPDVTGSCANCSRMARIEVYKELGGYDSKMRRAEDTDFNIRFGLSGGHFVGVKEALVEQTMTMGQEKILTVEKSAEFCLLEKHAGYLKKKGWYSFCHSWLEIRYQFLEYRYVDFFKSLFKLALRSPIKVVQKILWAMPAHDTRSQFKKWHKEEEPLVFIDSVEIPNPPPMITIAICCYNSEDTVERALKSALSQTWANFEVIIVDDGSSDSTAHVIKGAIEGHNNARLIQHEKNKRFPGALNTVISHAKGEFIAIFDDDDESLPHRLLTQYKTIIAYENKFNHRLLGCWGSGIRKYPNGYEVPLNAVGSRPLPPKSTEMIDFLLCFVRQRNVFYGSGTPSCSLMTRKETYDIVGFYDESMVRSEDCDFSVRLAKHGGHFIGCQERVFVQYSTGGVEKSPQMTHDSLKLVIEKHKDYLIEKKLYGYANLWNKLRLYHFGRNRIKAILVLLELFLKYPALTWEHFWTSAPKRLVHEFKMSRKKSN